jgi:hypothetical protein
MFHNFYWDMEQYLEKMSRSPNDAKVNAIDMFLIGTAKLWWRNRVKDLEFRSTNENIENWVEMKASLKAQFGLGNQAWVARN